MPRKVIDTDNNMEDAMDDASFDEWESVSSDFGTKIVWDVGTKFVGTFTGAEMRPLNEDGTDTALAASFTSKGEKFYSWCPWQLKEAIEKGRIVAGNVVFIHCVGTAENKDKAKNPVKKFDIKVKP